MSSLSREFERVPEISSSGLYFIASDMQNRNRDESLPGNAGLLTDVVSGVRPRLELSTLGALNQTFPGIQGIDHKGSNGDFRPYFVPWLTQSGKLFLPPEMYWIQSERDNFPGSDKALFSVEDAGDWEYELEKRTPPELIGDGRLKLLMTGFYRERTNGHQFTRPSLLPCWRGSLQFSGDNPGRLVTAALSHINETLVREEIHIWRVVEVNGQKDENH